MCTENTVFICICILFHSPASHTELYGTYRTATVPIEKDRCSGIYVRLMEHAVTSVPGILEAHSSNSNISILPHMLYIIYKAFTHCCGTVTIFTVPFRF